MPLIAQSLVDDVLAMYDEPPQNVAETADKWSAMIVAYSSAVIPASATATAAGEALRATLLGMATPGSGVPTLSAGLMAYAAQLGAGMAPAFVAVPPPFPPNFALLQPTASEEEAANNLASVIDAFFKTGSATPALGGPPVFWS